MSSSYQKVPDYFSAEESSITSVFDIDYNEKEHKAEENFKKNFKSLGNLAKIYQTDLKNGIDMTDLETIKQRSDKWGLNVFEKTKIDPVVTQMVQAMSSFPHNLFFIILIISIGITAVKEGWSKCLDNLLILGIQLFIMACQIILATREMKKCQDVLIKEKIHEVTVIRDGVEQQITNVDLLCGDLIKIKKDDEIYADCILVQGEVTMNEEPVLLKKRGGVPHRKIPEFKTEEEGGKYLTPVIFSGSKCIFGEGVAMVVVVGKDRFMNKTITELVEEQAEEEKINPHKKSVDESLTEYYQNVNDFSFFAALFVGLVLVLKEIIVKVSTNEDEENGFWSLKTLSAIIEVVFITYVLIQIGEPNGTFFLVWKTVDLKQSARIETIRKYCIFVTSLIATIFVVMLLGFFFVRDQVISTYGLLWVSFFVKVLAPFAFVYEYKDEKKPHPGSEEFKREEEKEKLTTGNNQEMEILNYGNRKQVIIFFMVQIMILVLIVALGNKIFNIESDNENTYETWEGDNGYHTTIIFSIFVYMAAFGLIGLRYAAPEEKNADLLSSSDTKGLLIFIVIILGQINFTIIGEKFGRTKQLDIMQQAISLGFSAVSFLIGFVCRFSGKTAKVRPRKKED